MAQQDAGDEANFITTDPVASDEKVPASFDAAPVVDDIGYQFADPVDDVNVIVQ